MKILFLAANPRGTDQLQLDEEAKKIEDGLERSKLRDQFTLVTKWAVDAETLRRAMLKEQPDIVHFSGHGAGEAGLVLVGQDGHPKPATADALSGLFEIFHNVKCVLLNACFAEVQAKAIVDHIDYVVGMKRAVRDDAAIAFATGFYDGLGYGLDIEDAFKLGCNAIQFEVASFAPASRISTPSNRDVGSVEELPPSASPFSDDLNPTLMKKEKIIQTNLGPLVQSDSLAEKLRATDAINTPEAIQQYRERAQEFLADRQLNPIEEFQLTTLAKVLGISDVRASQVLREEQQKIEEAKENYRQVFIRTIQKGYYPFDDQINHELQQLQKELGLTESEVREITLPIILKYEHSSKAQAPYKNPVLTTYQSPNRYSKILLGAVIAALGVVSTLLIIHSSQPPVTPSTDTSPTAPNGETGFSNPTTPHPMGPIPDPNEVEAVIKNATSVFVRSGEGMSYSDIDAVDANEVFHTIPQEKEWWPVRTQDGHLGYMHRSRINTEIGTPSVSFHPLDSNNPNPPQNVSQAIIQNATGVYVRAGKGTDYPELGTVAEGEVFTTIPQSEDWWPVKTQGGLLGYMHRSKINTEIGPASESLHPLDPSHPNPSPNIRRAVIQNADDGFLAVRAGQDRDAPELGRILEGEVFYTIPQDNDWWPVRTENGTLGYSNRAYINVDI